MDKQDRKPNGQFAPKGTGDQTGKKKWENPTEKVARRNKEYKPKVDALEKEWDKAYSDYWHAEPSKKAEYGKKLEEIDNKIKKLIEEWEGKKQIGSPFEQGLKEGFSEIIDEPAKREYEGGEKYTKGKTKDIKIGYFDDGTVNSNIAKWAKKNGLKVGMDDWMRDTIEIDGKKYLYKPRLSGGQDARLITIDLEEA